MRVVCVLLESAEKKEAFAEACLRLSPQIALGDRAVFLEIGKCRNLYTDASLQTRLLSLLSRFSLRAQMAIAKDIPTALALATFRAPNRESLPLAALQIYANPFQFSNSLEAVIDSLSQLGIKTLGDLSLYPQKSLTLRFGKETHYALQQLDFAASIPWPAFTPKEKLLEKAEIEPSHSVQEIEPLLFLAKTLLDRLLLRLRGQMKLASVLELRLSQEKYSFVKESERTLEISLAAPQGGTLSLLPILREHLEKYLRSSPLEAPIRSMELEIIKSVPGSLKQRDFFSKREEDREHLHSLLARITDRLGIDKVFFAAITPSYRPDRSWKKSLEEPKPAEESLPERPLRLLSAPQKLRQIDQYLLHSTHRWKILSMNGPERIGGEWWFGDEERDYYRVKTSSEELWVYSIPGTNEFFLHGIYD